MSPDEPLETPETMQDSSSIDIVTSSTHDTTKSTLESPMDPVSPYPPSHTQPKSSTNEAIRNTDRNISQNSVSSRSPSGSSLDELHEARQRGVRRKQRIFPRRDRTFAPLPDLRFEQSYLNSISGAKTTWDIAKITIRDQVFLPLIQGAVWSLAIAGWAHWNQTAHNSGATVGTIVKRWWFKTKKWSFPEKPWNYGGSAGLAASVGDVSVRWNGGEFWSFAD